MTIVLRSHRFVGDEHAILIVGECADRDHVLVRIESKDHDDETDSMFLSRDDWQILQALDPFNDAEDAMAGDFAETLSFIEDEGESRTSLEVIEVASRDVVYVEIKTVGDHTDFPLSVKLDRSQWYHLISLELFEPAPASAEAAEPMLSDDEPPSGQVH